MESEQVKKACRGKLCRRFAPKDYSVGSVVRLRDTWVDQLNDALGELVGYVEEMVDEHYAAFGAPEVNSWNLIVSEAEKKFKQLVVKYVTVDSKPHRLTILLLPTIKLSRLPR